MSNKDELPDKLIQLDHIRINRGVDRICTCTNRKYILDTTNRRVNCSSCGAVIDPYDAMYDLSKKSERMVSDAERLLEQRKQILNYKPWLLTIRSLEKQYRGKKKIPCCPRCDEPFYLEELVHWMGKPFADARIKRYQDEIE